MVIGRYYVQDKFGVDPEQMIDFQALVGDAGDNVPGVPSVGAKTAAKLLQEHGDLDAILAAAARGSGTKTLDTCHQHADVARLARQLVTLRRDVPLDVPLERLAFDGDVQTGPILEFCAEMEFVSLASKITQALERAA